MKSVSRSMLAAIVLAYGVVATAPAFAAQTHQPVKVCVKLLGIKILCVGK